MQRLRRCLDDEHPLLGGEPKDSLLAVDLKHLPDDSIWVILRNFSLCFDEDGGGLSVGTSAGPENVGPTVAVVPTRDNAKSFLQPTMPPSSWLELKKPPQATCHQGEVEPGQNARALRHRPPRLWRSTLAAVSKDSSEQPLVRVSTDGEVAATSDRECDGGALLHGGASVDPTNLAFH